ncbi:hypothetical protein ACL00X_08925 [Aeromonas diversa]|uniref:hypothetical protein n=1 Tax=Aeromonas diversa TaxID=502790 RepID=UPI0039A27EF4
MQPHGHFSMTRQGQLVICRPSGPFNLRGAIAYEQPFFEQVAPLAGTHWAIVEVATEFEAAGPEVIARFRRQFAWCAEQGCRYMAVVLEGGFKRYMADQIFRQLPFEALCYFGDEEEAIAWARAQLCPLTTAG